MSLYHSFPSLIDSLVDFNKGVDIVGGDNITRKLIQMPGEVNGIPGYFEYIIGMDGWCNHRLFRELKKGK